MWVPHFGVWGNPDVIQLEPPVTPKLSVIETKVTNNFFPAWKYLHFIFYSIFHENASFTRKTVENDVGRT